MKLMLCVIVLVVSLGATACSSQQSTIPPADPLADLLSKVVPGGEPKSAFDVRKVLEYLDTNEKDVTDDADKHPDCLQDIADVLAEFETVREKVLDPATTLSDIEDSIDQLHSDIKALYTEENEDIV
jgi:septal ring factor EnvC (AmiA/AmiB activator)